MCTKEIRYAGGMLRLDVTGMWFQFPNLSCFLNFLINNKKSSIFLNRLEQHSIDTSSYCKLCFFLFRVRIWACLLPLSCWTVLIKLKQLFMLIYKINWIVRAFWLVYKCVFIALWSTKMTWAVLIGCLQVVRSYNFMKEIKVYIRASSIVFLFVKTENHNFIKESKHVLRALNFASRCISTAIHLPFEG